MMPSDPLPLSPETYTGKRLVLQRAMKHGVNLMDAAAMAVIKADIIAIEQEARTLARAEVIAEAVAAVEGLQGVEMTVKQDMTLPDLDTDRPPRGVGTFTMPPAQVAITNTASDHGMVDRVLVLAALSRLGERE